MTNGMLCLMGLKSDRMGHQYGRWGTAVKQGHVTGVTVSGNFAQCDHCVKSTLSRSFKSATDLQKFGTQTQLPSTKDDPKCIKPGEKIGLDGVGPMEVDALGGYKGFFTFACYRTMAIWCELYKKPVEFYKIFKGFGAMLKSKYNSTMRLIVTDQRLQLL